MKIDINLIKKLRNYTNLGILECKKYLLLSNNNIKIAINKIREDEKIKNINNNFNNNKISSIIISSTSKNNDYGFLLKLNSETDFVLLNNNINKLINKIIINVINKKIKNIDIINKIIKNDIIHLSKIFKENIYISNFIYRR